MVDFIFKCVIEGSSGDSADSVDSESGIRGAARTCAVGAAGVAVTAGASDTADSEADTLKLSGGGSGHEVPLGETRKIAVEDFRVRYILDILCCSLFFGSSRKVEG